jgi:hypothetical protein
MWHYGKGVTYINRYNWVQQCVMHSKNVDHTKCNELIHNHVKVWIGKHHLSSLCIASFLNKFLSWKINFCNCTSSLNITLWWPGQSKSSNPYRITWFNSSLKQPDWVFGQPSTLVHGYCRLFPMGYSSLGANDHRPSFPIVLMECTSTNLPFAFFTVKYG